jgi:hypothetical protein
LGPPEGAKEVHENRYCYYSKGLEVDVDAGLVSGIVVMWKIDGSEPFLPFTGRVMYQDRELLINAGFNEDDLVSILGEPYHRDEDEDETILFYEPAPDAELQVEFSLRKALKAIIMTSDPLLSSKSQREAYRVTGEWPPKYGRP